MSELKRCPLCGAELKVHGPEDWKPTFYDPDSGGDPYTAVCDCGFQFQNNHYDYAEFVEALNRRADGWIPVSERLPTEKDADCHGLIIAHSTTVGRSTVCVWHHILNDGVTTHWMPLPEPPV